MRIRIEGELDSRGLGCDLTPNLRAFLVDSLTTDALKAAGALKRGSKPDGAIGIAKGDAARLALVLLAGFDAGKAACAEERDVRAAVLDAIVDTREDQRRRAGLPPFHTVTEPDDDRRDWHRAQDRTLFQTSLCLRACYETVVADAADPSGNWDTPLDAEDRAGREQAAIDLARRHVFPSLPSGLSMHTLQEDGRKAATRFRALMTRLDAWVEAQFP